MNDLLAISRRVATSCAWFWLFAAAIAERGALAADSHPRPQVGEIVRRFEFQDVWFLPRSLDDFNDEEPAQRKRVFALVFANTTCPLVQRYWPRLKELEATYRDAGVQFLAVNVGAGDSILDMAAQGVEFGVPFPLVKDVDGQCAAACGVDRTPEVVLIDAERRLRYRGRIDNQIRLGGRSAGAVRHELRDAIDDLLAGRAIAVAETPVDGCLITPPARKEPSEAIDYRRQIAPLMAKHCTECHQADTAAPFALQTYDDVASHAEMIAEVVADRRMPPWYAASDYGEFVNCRAMPRADREAIVAWVRGGCAPGDDVGAESTPQEGADSLAATESSSDVWANRHWSMGEPDLVLEAAAEFDVPADGYVDYRYALLPRLFAEDLWFETVEVLPSNPRVVHHCNLGIASLGAGARNVKLVTGYVPGGGPMELGQGVAGKIPAGALLGLQVHLTTTGKPEKCRIRVGFRFPRDRVEKELRFVELASHRFKIPPRHPYYQLSASRTVEHDVTAYGMFAHMHVRGRDVTFRAHQPSGEPEVMLMIPNYSFDWQLPYYLPRGAKKYRAGTRFEAVAHFDNSAFNPYNPDPTAEVREGQQTYQEMMYGYVFYTVDNERLNLQIDPRTGASVRTKKNAR